MYTCVRALLRQRGENQRLTETQVNSFAVRELDNDYSDVYLILTHPSVTSEMSLALVDVEDLVYKLSETTTVDQWLQSLGTASLPTSDTVPKATAMTAKYNDVIVAGYDVQKIHQTGGPGGDWLDSELRDLLVTRYGSDYKQLYEHVLWTVNGLCHIADYTPSNGVQISEGGASMRKANANDIGMISFLSMGTLDFRPVTEDMMIKFSGLDYKRGFVLSLPDVDLSTKTVMLSIGGFLHFANHHYKVIGDHSILVEWWKIPFMERYFNSNKLIDMTKFTSTMSTPIDHLDSLDLNQAMTDESIKAYMQLSQTFVILLDATNMYYERHAVEATGLPGRYITRTPPKYPLQLENGLLPEYMAFTEDSEIVLAVNNNRVNRYVHNTRDYEIDNYVSGARRSNRPFNYGAAYLLELGCDVVTN